MKLLCWRSQALRQGYPGILVPGASGLGVPNPVASNLVVCKFFYAEALFCALLRFFALFRGLLFVLICALSHAFACFCERPRLE